MKDVVMAKAANVSDVYAAYGRAQHRPEYGLLKDVTHWSDEQVEQEAKLDARGVRPTFTLKNSFAELLSLFDFRSHEENGRSP